MIEWYRDIYLDQMTKKKFDKLKTRIEKEKPTLNVYAICLPTNSDNLFDIINVNELLFRYYRRKTVHVIGLTNGKESAIEVLEEIIQDMLLKTGELKTKEFFNVFV